MSNLIFSEADRDEQGFIKLPAPPAQAAQTTSPAAARPLATPRRLPSPAQARQRRHMVAVAAGTLVILVILFALMAILSRQVAPSSAPTAERVPATRQPTPPAPIAPIAPQRAIVARWDYTDPGNVTALPPGQAIDHVIGHALGGTWLYVALDRDETRALWIQAADVPGLAAHGPDLTVPPTPVPAPVVVRVPAPPAPPVVVQEAAPPAPVCTDQNVRELGFQAGWAVVWRGLPLGTVEAWSCVSAEDARQQAQQAEQQMIHAYEAARYPTATPRKAE